MAFHKSKTYYSAPHSLGSHQDWPRQACYSAEASTGSSSSLSGEVSAPQSSKSSNNRRRYKNKKNNRKNTNNIRRSQSVNFDGRRNYYATNGYFRRQSSLNTSPETSENGSYTSSAGSSLNSPATSSTPAQLLVPTTVQEETPKSRFDGLLNDNGLTSFGGFPVTTAKSNVKRRNYNRGPKLADDSLVQNFLSMCSVKADPHDELPELPKFLTQVKPGLKTEKRRPFGGPKEKLVENRDRAVKHLVKGLASSVEQVKTNSGTNYYSPSLDATVNATLVSNQPRYEYAPDAFEALYATGSSQEVGHCTCNPNQGPLPDRTGCWYHTEKAKRYENNDYQVFKPRPKFPMEGDIVTDFNPKNVMRPKYVGTDIYTKIMMNLIQQRADHVCPGPGHCWTCEHRGAPHYVGEFSRTMILDEMEWKKYRENLRYLQQSKRN